MTTISYLPMILLAILAVGAALIAGFLILRSGPKERPAPNQRPPGQPTDEWLNREGHSANSYAPKHARANLSRKKFGSASMILVGSFSMVAVLGVFVGAIVVYGGINAG